MGREALDFGASNQEKGIGGGHLWENRWFLGKINGPLGK